MPFAASPVITVGAMGCWTPTCTGALARTIDPVGAPEDRKEIVPAELRPIGSAVSSLTSATTTCSWGPGGGTTALRHLRSGLAVRRDILGLGMIDQNHRRLHS